MEFVKKFKNVKCKSRTSVSLVNQGSPFRARHALQFKSPIVTDACLIAAAENYPKLMAFDVMGDNNGCFRWTYDFESPVTGGPIMDNDGVIYVGTMGKLYAIEPEE